MNPDAVSQTVMVQKITMKGRDITTCVKLQKHGEGLRLHIPMASLKDVKRITITPDFGRAKLGESGYYAFPDGTNYAFEYRDEKTFLIKDMPKPVLGVKTPRQMYMSHVKGMAQSLWLQAYRGTQEYQTKYIFRLGEAGIQASEDIVIDFIPVKNEIELK